MHASYYIKLIFHPTYIFTQTLKGFNGKKMTKILIAQLSLSMRRWRIEVIMLEIMSEVHAREVQHEEDTSIGHVCDINHGVCMQAWVSTTKQKVNIGHIIKSSRHWRMRMVF